MSERTIKGHRVSGRQLDVLWEFLNSHRDIAFAYNRSLQAKEYSCRKWVEITEALNAQGGARKDWRAWSKYWVDFKAKLKKRCSAIRSTQSGTEGEPATAPQLSDIEKKFLQIVGEDFSQGLPDIRVEPFAEPAASTIEFVLLCPVEFQGSPVPSTCGQTPMFSLPPSTSTPAPAPATPERPVRSQRRRRRREPFMSQVAARRALVQSSQMRAEAAVRNSQAFEMIGRGIADMGQKMGELLTSIQRIESYMATIHGACQRAAE